LEVTLRGIHAPNQRRSRGRTELQPHDSSDISPFSINDIGAVRRLDG